MSICTVCATLIFCSCCAATADLVVIKDTGNTVPSHRYLENIQVPSKEKIMQLITNQKQKLNRQSISANDVGYPNQSIFTPGVVIKHKIQKGFFDTVPLFVIGADAQSLRWAKTNIFYLKKIDAIGIITNVRDKAQTQEIERKLGIKLISTNLQGLDRIVGTTHYPFLIKNGWIEQ